MFVSITTHPNREDWRSLFLTEADALADNAAFLALFPGVDGVAASVEPATLDDAAEFVDNADESYFECKAEAGMGAVSLGLDPYDGMATVQAPGGALYVAARAMVDAARAAATPAPAPSAPSADDIPF